MDLPRAREPRAKRSWGRLGVAASVGVVTLAVVLTTRRSATLTVDPGTLVVDTVRLQSFGRDTRAPGSLVAEQVDWVTARASARVERVDVRVGDRVRAGLVLLQLTNPDVQIQALQAEQQARQAEREAFEASTSLAQQRITQEGAIATLRTQWANAQQDLQASDSLLQRGLVAPMDGLSKRALFEELDARLRGELRRLDLMRASEPKQLAFLQGQAKRLQEIAAFQQARLAAMTVRAPTSGVIQEINLQSGQWVPEGSLLAKVILPGRLKAVLRVPETLASDVAVGQAVAIDTRNGIVRGTVSTKAPAAQGGSVVVEVPLAGTLPPGAVSDLAVEGTIALEAPTQALVVGRPSGARGGTGTVFRLNADGTRATRVPVAFGRITLTRAEVLSGLRAGDRIVISDVSAWGTSPSVRLSVP
ncbi:MAG: HlyD family efflux transporter periplasmic adaptor subunit [Gemmatimonas sp.]|nr:HlyD family efflux transporter periplasmic adaptor subunit [Gemmatimonas sp.]